MLGVNHVNLFSLDVEGSELGVLRTIDFKRVSFDVLVMESNQVSPSTLKETTELWNSAGYIQYMEEDNFTINHRS